MRKRSRIVCVLLSHDVLYDLECLSMVDEFICGNMCVLYMCLCIYAVSGILGKEVETAV